MFPIFKRDDISLISESLKANLVKVASLIVPSQMKHHAEAEACDLLMEVEQLDLLLQYVDDAAYNRKEPIFSSYFHIGRRLLDIDT